MEAVFHKGAYAAPTAGSRAGSTASAWPTGCARGVDEVDIVGIATDYCVRATAEDAVHAGLRTRVLVDLTAGVAPESTAAALAEMRSAGVDLVRAT